MMPDTVGGNGLEEAAAHPMGFGVLIGCLISTASSPSAPSATKAACQVGWDQMSKSPEMAATGRPAEA